MAIQESFSGNLQGCFQISCKDRVGARLFFSEVCKDCFLEACMGWIAQEVADTKFTADLRPLFQLGKQIAEKQPKTLVTDGAPNFHEAYEQEFWTQKVSTRAEHIREIAFDGARHNNKMERMNGEIRDREQCMRH